MPFPTHYLVLVVTDTDFRYALISVRIVPEGIYQSLVMEDIGWLDVERICGRGREARAQNAMPEGGFGSPTAESSKSVLEIGRNVMLADGLLDSDWRPWSCANFISIAGISSPSFHRLRSNRARIALVWHIRRLRTSLRGLTSDSGMYTLHPPQLVLHLSWVPAHLPCLAPSKARSRTQSLRC